jgi:hypothetical protein
MSNSPQQLTEGSHSLATRRSDQSRWADLLALKLAWAFDVPDVEEDCEE